MDKEKTFESALLELETIVKELESGNVELDDAINKYTKAMELAAFCGKKIEGATAQVNKVLNEQNKLEDLKVS